jgi:hypothetical protein
VIIYGEEETAKCDFTLLAKRGNFISCSFKYDCKDEDELIIGPEEPNPNYNVENSVIYFVGFANSTKRIKIINQNGKLIKGINNENKVFFKITNNIIDKDLYQLQPFELLIKVLNKEKEIYSNCSFPEEVLADTEFDIICYFIFF